MWELWVEDMMDFPCQRYDKDYERMHMEEW